MAITLEEVNARLEELVKFIEKGKTEQQQLIGYRARLMEEEAPADKKNSKNEVPKEKVKA